MIGFSGWPSFLNMSLPPFDTREGALMAGVGLVDRTTGKQEIRPRFDPSLYTPERLTEIERVLRLVAATQAGTENGR